MTLAPAGVHTLVIDCDGYLVLPDLVLILSVTGRLFLLRSLSESTGEFNRELKELTG